MSDQTTIMGKVTSVYGVKGWVKVFSYTQPKENLCKYKVWTLEQNGSQRSVSVTQCKAHGNGLVAQIENCSDREVAKAYCDSLVRISISELPALSEEDFYWHQLEGLNVVTVQGSQILGKVHHIMETGSNDVLVVKKCAGSIDSRERLVPYILEQVVKNVDLDRRVIEVDWDPEF